ncbi:MAG: hypothetical protein HYV09_30340 [Deltaproteobacteria bacterium]|nr:hypothetical protein [Deltaproteobacteria bacterium]
MYRQADEQEAPGTLVLPAETGAGAFAFALAAVLLVLSLVVQPTRGFSPWLAALACSFAALGVATRAYRPRLVTREGHAELSVGFGLLGMRLGQVRLGAGSIVTAGVVRGGWIFGFEISDGACHVAWTTRGASSAERTVAALQALADRSGATLRRIGEPAPPHGYRVQSAKVGDAVTWTWSGSRVPLDRYGWLTAACLLAFAATLTAANARTLERAFGVAILGLTFGYGVAFVMKFAVAALWDRALGRLLRTRLTVAPNRWRLEHRWLFVRRVREGEGTIGLAADQLTATVTRRSLALVQPILRVRCDGREIARLSGLSAEAQRWIVEVAERVARPNPPAPQPAPEILRSARS